MELSSVSNRLVVTRIFTLCKDEVFRIPSTCREVQVLSGVAWITVAGEDIILTYKQKASLVLNKDEPIVSSLSDVPLILAATIMNTRL
jgi:hypothetical protein